MNGIEKIIPIYDKVHKVLYFDETYFTDVPFSLRRLDDNQLLSRLNKLNEEIYNEPDNLPSEELISFVFIAQEFKSRLIDSRTLFEKTYEFQDNIILEKDLSMIILADWFYIAPPNSNHPNGRIKRFLTGEENV